jgi:acetyl esterase
MKQLTRFFLLLLSINVLADCLPVKVRNPEGNYIIPGTKGDIVYARPGGTELALDAYVQKRGDQRPAVIVIHGGGFTSGSRVSFIGQFLEMLTSAGYNWFAIDYRKNGLSHYKESLDDVRAALAFIRCHAKEFRIDPGRIALLGEDTGATLAALLAAENPAGVKANVMIGGVYDLRSVKPYQDSADAQLLAQISPINNLVRGMPDTLLIHGSHDTEVPSTQATDYFIAFQQAGENNVVLEFVSAIHRPENWRPEHWKYKSFLLRWLNVKLKMEAADHEPYSSPTLQKDIVFSAPSKLKMDAYIPKGRGPFPAVIIAHGGGWEAGDKVTYATPIFEPLAKAGFAWFSIDYRLTPQVQHQDQLNDLREAIRYVKASARSFRVDPKRIAILGESASAQMVSYLATNAQTENEAGLNVAAVVSLYGVYDLAAMVKDHSPRALHARLFGLSELNDKAWRMLRRYSPLHNLETYVPHPMRIKEMPPLLLICGTKDGLYQQQEAFAQRLQSLHARFDSLAIEGAPHGIENWEGHPEWMNYKQKLVDWLRVQLRR